MAVAIRLSRGGAKKRPYYRIVVADSRSARDGKYLEQIGTYNPVLAKDNPDRVKFNEERARYWLGVGAQASDRVARFLDAAGIKERAVRNNPNKAEPGQKAKDRAEDRAAKLVTAEEAANAPVEEAPVAEEAPAAEEATNAPADAESDSTGSVKTEVTAEAVADAVADEVPADASAQDAAAIAEEVAEGGPAAPAEEGPAAEEAPAEEAPAAEDAPGEEKAEG